MLTEMITRYWLPAQHEKLETLHNRFQVLLEHWTKAKSVG